MPPSCRPALTLMCSASRLKIAGRLQPASPRHTRAECSVYGVGWPAHPASPVRYYCGCRCCGLPTCGCDADRDPAFDTRWWEFNDDPKWSALAVALGIIGLVYLGMGVRAGGGAQHHVPGLPLAFLVVRSIFLAHSRSEPVTRWNAIPCDHSRSVFLER